MVSFNPRTHTGCDLSFGFNDLCPSVSIHAPTRGATSRLDLMTSVRLFQSTHPHGVRHTPLMYCSIGLCFNPRTHTGCDIFALSNIKSTLCFNPRTHTGCDNGHLGKCPPLFCFNPRTHTGCDTIKILRRSSDPKFQSTHPHGVRRRYKGTK